MPPVVGSLNQQGPLSGHFILETGRMQPAIRDCGQDSRRHPRVVQSSSKQANFATVGQQHLETIGRGLRPTDLLEAARSQRLMAGPIENPPATTSYDNIRREVEPRYRYALTFRASGVENKEDVVDYALPLQKVACHLDSISLGGTEVSKTDGRRLRRVCGIYGHLGIMAER